MEYTEKLLKEGKKPDLVVLDPPYTEFQSHVYYNKDFKKVRITRMKDLIALMKPKYVITCGFNSNGMGKKRGYKKLRLLLLHHGGNHNDTICLLEERKEKKDGKNRKHNRTAG